MAFIGRFFDKKLRQRGGGHAATGPRPGLERGTAVRGASAFVYGAPVQPSEVAGNPQLVDWWSTVVILKRK